MVGFFLIIVLLTVILPRKRVGQVWMETIITYFSPFVNRKRENYLRRGLANVLPRYITKKDHP